MNKLFTGYFTLQRYRFAKHFDPSECLGVGLDDFSYICY